MSLINCANVACGGHASDPKIMLETVRLAKKWCVRVGAHPGYPDMQGTYSRGDSGAQDQRELSLYFNVLFKGFGRRKFDLTPEEYYALMSVTSQTSLTIPSLPLRLKSTLFRQSLPAGRPQSHLGGRRAAREPQQTAWHVVLCDARLARNRRCNRTRCQDVRSAPIWAERNQPRAQGQGIRCALHPGENRPYESEVEQLHTDQTHCILKSK